MLSRVLEPLQWSGMGARGLPDDLEQQVHSGRPAAPLDSPFSRSTAKPVPLKDPSSAKTKKTKKQTHLKLLMAPLRIYKSRVETDIYARLSCHIFFFDHGASRIQMRPRTVWRACLIHAATLSFSSKHSGRAQRIHEGLGPLCWLLNIASWRAAEGPATIVVESRVQPFCCLGHKRRLRAAYEVDFVPLVFFLFLFLFYSSSVSKAKWTAFNLNAM